MITQSEDIDNCPKNTKELKMLDTREVTMSGTFVSVSPETAQLLVGEQSATTSDNLTVITPSDDLLSSHFLEKLYWVGDYSNVNTGATAGFMAIEMLNVLNTNGFRLQTTDKEKGQFEFSFIGHYSLSSPSTVPYTLYVMEGV